jgi:hypothetical protein
VRIHLVTSSRAECGIAEHGKMLIEALREVAPEFSVTEAPMDPNAPQNRELWRDPQSTDLVHLNHQGALLSQWKLWHVEQLQRLGLPVVVTLHDTYEKLSIMRERELPVFPGADAIVIHEPVEGLTGEKVHLIRQGIPPLPPGARRTPISSHHPPIVGTIGFPFGCKNVDVICKASAAAGWGVLLIVPTATVEQCREWQAMNGEAEIIPHFLPRAEALVRLHGCDATMFHAVSGNSGTTGSVRMGIAARVPVITTSPAINRQLKDLGDDPALLWANSAEEATEKLLLLEREPEGWIHQAEMVVALAEGDSWLKVAERYAEVYRGLRH